MSLLSNDFSDKDIQENAKNFNSNTVKVSRMEEEKIDNEYNNKEIFEKGIWKVTLEQVEHCNKLLLKIKESMSKGK